MDSPKPMDTTKAAPVEINYGQVNVADIMARIQKAAAEGPPAEISEANASREAVRVETDSDHVNAAAEGPPAEISEANASREAAPSSHSPISTSPESPQPAPSEPHGAKPKIKKIVLKLMRPFFPVIRFLALPIHEELRATIKSLHETNIRLDNLYPLLNMQAEKYDRSLERLEVSFDRKRDVLEASFDRKRDLLEARLDVAGERTHRGELRLDLLEERIKDLDKSMDYIRLLHNLDHNLVVELTKLKVETDTLKSKFRILEKDQELAQKRERTLEEKDWK